MRRLLRRLASDLHPVQARAHGLPGGLVVSLTSYPARFRDLHRTLGSLLNQTVRPDHVVLWVAPADAARLPRRVRALERRGLLVREVPDIRSYKKLVFALPEFPDAHIATADDDVFYPPDWLAELVAGLDGGRVATCHRAHRVPPHRAGGPVRYRDWEWDVGDDAARRPSADLLPTGVGGVLYPPGSLHPDVTDAAAFTGLAPTADDLWFYWMARRVGTTYRKVGGKFDLATWPGSQDDSLYKHNAAADATENDRQFAALFARYGDPTAFP